VLLKEDVMDYGKGIREPDTGTFSALREMSPDERYVVFKTLNRRIRRNIIQGGEYGTRAEAQRIAAGLTLKILGFNPYGAP
jgi:hypothetical protein